MIIPSRQSLKSLILFSLPIILGQLGQMLIGIGDVMVAGRHSTLAVAAIGVGNGLIAPVFMVGLGLCMAIAPLLSTYQGEGKKIQAYFFPSLFFASIISIVLMLFLWGLTLIVPWLKFDKSIEGDTLDYIRCCIFSLPGGLLFFAAKEYLQAKEKVFFANALAFAAVFFNLLFNTIFVFGAGVFPSFGIIGLAYATILTRTLMAIILIGYCLRIDSHSFKWAKEYLIRLMKNGFVIAAGVLLEVLAFCSVTLLIGRMPAIESAAHNIVLNLASLTFMIPLAVSSGVASRVGLFLGEKNALKIREVALSGLTLSILVMAITGLSFAFFPNLILGLFTKEEELLLPAGKILAVAAAFQLFDGIQVTLSGVLRGLHQPKATTIMAIIGYWLLGIPIGYYLAFRQGEGAYGLWKGLALGLLVVSLGLSGVVMRAFRSLSFSSIVIALLLFAVGENSFAEEKIGIIKIARGEVIKRDKKTGKEAALTNGSEIFKQDTLITGPKSYLKLVLEDETVIDLGSSSAFEVENFEMQSKTNKNIMFNFIKGSLRTQVKNKVIQGEIVMKAKGVAMGVRGTTIFSEIKRNKKTETQILLSEGQVELDLPVNPQKMTQVIRRGKVVKSRNFTLPEGVLFSTAYLDGLDDLSKLSEKLVELTPLQLKELREQNDEEELKKFLSTILLADNSQATKAVLNPQANLVEEAPESTPTKKVRRKKHWKELLPELHK